MKTLKQISLLCLFWMIGMSVSANSITYKAKEKLKEGAGIAVVGLHIDCFDVHVSSHTFSGGTGTITFDGDVTIIGNYAFFGCSNLTSVTLPNTVTKIGGWAFQDCSGLTGINIPNLVTEISLRAFFGCSSLANITLPSSLTYIEEGAFEGCSSLTSITIPGHAVVQNKAFKDCSSLTSVSILGSWTWIPYNIFEGCSSLTKITIPNTVTEIGGYAFSGCSSLTSIAIPNSVTKIAKYAFEGCSGLTGITIPNLVTEIGAWAFDGCSGLTSITIPSSVTTIGACAFANCIGLKSITTKIKDPNSCVYGATLFENVSTTTKLVVPVGTTSAYQNSSTWNYFTNIVEEYVSSISLDMTSVSVLVGNTLTLTPTVLAPNADNKSLSWTTTNPDVASVSSTGVVTAKKGGVATITAKATDGSGKSASCTVTVKQHVTSISLSETSKDIYINDNLPLTATVNPSDATDKSVSWSSSNSGIASVSSNGVVTGLSTGTATITATANDGSGKSASCTVTVKQHVTSISLSETSKTIYNNDKITLIATVAPSDATDKSVTWSSSNSDIASVSSTGVVTGISAGTATITATANDGSGKTATCNITVKQYVTSISLSETSKDIYINDNLPLTATVYPSDATDKSVAWSSSNSSIASVSSTGVVTGLSAGTATITVTANDGSRVSASCVVNVLEARITKIVFDIKSKEIHQYENFTITPTFTPDNASNKNLTWSSDDETVATVENGVVTGVGVGETTIMAVAQDGSNKFAFCSVTVLPNYAESISLDLTSKLLNPGETVTLMATVLPATTTDKSVTWTSTDEKVATVAADGKVTAVGAGTTTITAKTNDGTNLSVSCTISVTGNSTIVNSSNVTSYLDIKTGSTLTLTDGSIYNINIAEEIEGVNVKYNRVYKNTKWQPWFTPFDVAITSDMAADFEFAKFAGAFMDEEGVMYITVVKLNAGDVVKANIPYMVKALNTDGSTALTMTVPSTTVRKTVETECQMMQSSELNFKYCGIYNQKVSTTEDLGWYYFSANFTYSKCTKAGTKINPFRFVMYITERDDSPYATYAPASEIKVLTIGEDNITAIEEIYNRANLGDDAAYDLTGRKVGPNFKGIVIKNGKKMLQK